MKPLSAANSMHRLACTVLLWAFVACCCLLRSALPAHATYDVSGHWSPSADSSAGNTSRYAVHLLLLRGDGVPYHSRILYWRAIRDNQFHGRQWGWKKDVDDGCQTFPSPNDTSLTMLEVPLTDMDLFCAGHCEIGGTAFMPGGTDPSTGLYGENRSRVFEVGAGSESGSWSNPGTMAEWRWYPTSVALRDSRAVVLGGSRHREHYVWGGRRNGSLPSSPVGDSLSRFAPIVNGAWDRSVIPSPFNAGIPTVRERHTSVEMGSGFSAPVYFGGRNASGEALKDAWMLKRDAQITADDYRYRWQWINPNPGLEDEESRSDHTAIFLPHPLRHEMLVFGGLKSDSTVHFSSVWRLFNDLGFKWAKVDSNSSAAPSPRYGHVAFYDSLPAADPTETIHRMIVSGGSSSAGGGPSEDKVWEFQLDNSDPNKGTWHEMPETTLGSGRRPDPRVGCVAVLDPETRRYGGSGTPGRAAFLFGGDLGSQAYSDTLWRLWVFDTGKVGWEWVATDTNAARPGARSHYSLALDKEQGEGRARLYLNGGLDDGGPVDAYVWVLDPWAAAPPEWDAWATHADTLSGHTDLLQIRLTHARVAEVYDPVSGWNAHEGSNLLQPTYPPTFLVPGGGNGKSRIVSIAQDDTTYYLDIPPGGTDASGWQAVGGNVLGFSAETGVQYLPGKLLLAGGRSGSTVVGTAKTLDAGNLSAGWASTNSLEPRFFHNLVLLPNGHVLAIGGMRSATTGNVAPSLAEKRPQIWNPSTGQWTSAGTLETQATMRNYHSSCILLPDARVMSASGDFQSDKYKFNIFCPPYLFRENASEPSELAERPEISNTAVTLAYGKPFTICVPTEDSLTRAVLIRPGMTTHSFDQNQRYVPLSRVTKLDDPSRLLVTAPASPDSAPPGDYMLFLTGSADGGDVPSIAEWVRLGDTAGVDSCDVVDPGELLPSPELISDDRIYFEWTASADDLTLGASGPSKIYRVRRSADPIHSEGTWSTATVASLEEGQEIPDTVGTAEAGTVDGLQACTTYHFALRAEDDNQNLSAIHDTVTAKTLCGGGGGGDPNSALDEVVSAETGETVSSRGETRRAGLSTQSGGSGTVAALVVETESLGDGAWRFTLQAPAILEEADASKMLRQVRDAAGAWQTQSDLDLEGAGARLGLAATGRTNRKVFPGSWELVEIASTLRSPTGDLALASAQHSSLGDLAQSAWSGDGTASLASGETLTLVYEPSQLETAPSEDWFALLQRAEGSSAPTRDVALSEGMDLPKSFALYQNQPNPFSHSTSIRFDLPRPTSVRLTIYDIAGRKVRTLTSSDWPAGRHALAWDHRSDAGVQLGAGAYIYRLTTDEYRSEKKMILLTR